MEEKLTFKAVILKNIKSNGFPQNKVSLPLEKLYEVADRRDENLNTILDELEGEGISHTKTNEKIIFFKLDINPSPSSEEFSPDMMKKAQEMMGKMSPEQIQKAQDMLSNMSSEERSEMMNKVKGMGLF